MSALSPSAYTSRGTPQRRSPLLRLVRILVDIPEEGPCLAVVRAERSGFFQFGLRLGKAAELHVENAERVGRVRQLRIEFFGLLEL